MVDEKKGYTFTDKRGEAWHDERFRAQSGENGSAHREGLEIDFATLIMSFASAAMISLGEVPDPATGRVNRDLHLARQNIDIISLLQVKTKGNLSSEEEALIEGILYELRLGYVEAERGKK